MTKKPEPLTRSAALIWAATAALAGGSAAIAQEDDVLELTLALGTVDANFNPTNASVFRLAEEFGFYEKHGLDVTMIALDGTPQAVAALNSGAVDLAHISIDAAIRLRAENDLPIRGIVEVSIGSAFLIAARSEIETVEDLADRSYAIADYGSLDHSLTQAVLRSFGLPDDAPDYVAIGAPDVRIQALAAGQVDATTVSFGTYSSIEGTPGVHVLVANDEFSRHTPAIDKFVAVLESTIEEKEEALQRFTNALVDAARAMEADPERWIEAAVAARPDLSRERIEATSDMIATRWCINGCMDPEQLEASVAFVYWNPDFENVAEIESEDIADLRFTTRAMETLGVAGGTGLDARE